MDTLGWLRKNPALGAGNPHLLTALAKVCGITACARNKVVARVGAQQRHILLIGSGTLELFRKNRTAGTQILVGTLSAPSLFGDAEYYAGMQHWGVSARTTEPTTLIEIPFKAFDTLIDSDGRVAAALYRETSARHMLAVQIMQVMALQQVQHKILRLLWAQGTVTEAGTRRAHLAPSDLARALGINRRTIARNLEGLESRGLLRREGFEAEVLLTADAVFWQTLSQGFGASWELRPRKKPAK